MSLKFDVCQTSSQCPLAFTMSIMITTSARQRCVTVSRRNQASLRHCRCAPLRRMAAAAARACTPRERRCTMRRPPQSRGRATGHLDPSRGCSVCDPPCVCGHYMRRSQVHAGSGRQQTQLHSMLFFTCCHRCSAHGRCITSKLCCVSRAMLCRLADVAHHCLAPGMTAWFMRHCTPWAGSSEPTKAHLARWCPPELLRRLRERSKDTGSAARSPESIADAVKCPKSASCDIMRSSRRKQWQKQLLVSSALHRHASCGKYPSVLHAPAATRRCS